jgi:hypothetical protein
MRSLVRVGKVGVATLLTLLLVQIQPAFGSTVSAATFSGGSGTVSVGGTLYAKNGGALTLTVTTSNDTKCVDVTGAHAAHQTSSTAKTSWTFSFTAGVGNGVQTVTASASPNFNANNCTGQSQSPQSASYILDNAGPVVTASLSPTPNAAGWNNSNVSITWSASDAGSGVASGPTPATDSQSSNTTGVTKTSSATDRLGNSGSGSVTVKLDKMSPSITGSRSPAANANGWNNTDVTVSFICSDSISGIQSCPGSTTLTSSGPNQSVTGTADDNADNSASATVSGINIDKAAPTLSGAPTTSPNVNGWYKNNVTIQWTCGDSLSGIAGSCPSNSTISSEGSGLTASASVSDKAGNSTNTTSSPEVSIDKTAPNTSATAPTTWNNTDVTVSLNAADALSGVATTLYRLDGGSQQSGTSVSISSEGDHTLSFWSVDKAGNVETAKTVEVKIDKTPPTINHGQSPAANGNGWNNTEVTVTFTCADTLSGIAGCTASQTVTTEGANQSVTGTATDNAGNTATDPATVSIDKTAPNVSAAADRNPNANGWYKADVIVSFTCSDALSGIAHCPSAMTLGEGADQSANGTAKDAADNTASTGVNGINVDETAPSLSGTATTSPNGDGWYGEDVTVHWSCSDTLSGIDGDCPADSTVTGEGDNLSASASVADLAGNSTDATVPGIQIDRTAPTTSASVPDPLASGWYAGDVQVTLNGLDSLSGVKTTYYSVDGGGAETYSGPFSHGLKGVHTITFWSLDKAGNLEDSSVGHSITLKIDGIPPTITGSRTPAANGFGWNNSPVTVSFNCSDAESGIAACDPGVLLSNAGAGQSYTGLAQDNAGNTASATVSDINIDLTAPSLAGAVTTIPNAFGWYKGNVTVHWTGQDGLSGIDPATQPADSVITGEGSTLGAGPVYISDQAGNVGSASVSGIKIDKTAPAISGATVNDDGTPRSANAAGWFNSAVRVRFTCSDGLSGVQECGSDVVLSGDGANQSANGVATDKADNAANTSVTGINIDSQAPTTTADIQCTKKNGWCRGTQAAVVLTSVDQAGLSGVKQIKYSTNNGSSWQYTNGASATVTLNLNGSGKAKVLFYAIDNAGNAETQDGVEVQYDTIAPTVTHTLIPPANAYGWNKADTTVHFDASDDSDGSGVDPSTVTADQTISTETVGTLVIGSADDLAGNTGTDSVTVKLDKTAPTISGSASPGPNANGWNKGPVTVHFTCGDGLSGIATCPADVVLSTSGAAQSVTGTAIDKAGNTKDATVSGINIDSVKPTIDSISVTNGAIYTLGDPAIPSGTPTCTASDGLSGLDGGCNVTVSGGQPNGVGTFSFIATATDKAGNTTTQSGSYKVIYRWDGFLQPINDTAHQIDQGVSVFKAASTVPVKFQLRKADGTVVQSSSLPQWLTPAKGSPTTASVDESVYSDPATSGSTYRWDSTGQQYIYNWGTAKNQVGYYWRIGVTFDDGQTYFVNIGLR